MVLEGLCAGTSHMTVLNRRKCLVLREHSEMTGASCFLLPRPCSSVAAAAAAGVAM